MRVSSAHPCSHQRQYVRIPARVFPSPGCLLFLSSMTQARVADLETQSKYRGTDEQANTKIDRLNQDELAL